MQLVRFYKTKKTDLSIKPLYIKNMSKGDWELINKLIDHYRLHSVADVVRIAVRDLAKNI